MSAGGENLEGALKSSRRAFAVVLLALSGSPENEAPRLAAELGCTLYEARLRIVGPKPLVLLQTDDAARAVALTASLTSRRHAAVAIDARDVPSSLSMVDMDHFRFGTESIEMRANARGATGATDPLGYDEILALLPAVHRVTEINEGSSVDKAGKRRTSGSFGKFVDRRPSTKPPEERTAVLYIYNRTRSPWILRETAQTSGPALGIGRFHSFRAASAHLRGVCTRAIWDERLLQANAGEEPMTGTSGYVMSNVRTSDLLAYALASFLAVGRDNPYRT